MTIIMTVLFVFYVRTGGMTCVRCFQFTMRSLNVVQIYTEGLEKCYTNEAAAMAKCPTEESIISGLSREIILYSKLICCGQLIFEIVTENVFVCVSIW